MSKLQRTENFIEKAIRVGAKLYFVDALDPETNTVYEFNGDFWHGNPEIYGKNDINPITKATFGHLYNKTGEKENMLKSAGYKVISVWKSDYKKELKK